MDDFTTTVFVLSCIVLGLCIIYFVWYLVWGKPKAEREIQEIAKKMQELQKYAEFSIKSGGNVLLLKKRGFQLAYELNIMNDTDVHFGYRPDEYVYTGATVGGIHTGGFHKREGYAYISGETPNGKCKLIYRPKSGLISYIQLTDELYEQAKKSAIKDYLNQHKQIVVIEPPRASSAELSALTSLKVGTVGSTSMLLDIGKRGYPSREKCEKIKRWISGGE